MRNKFIWIVLGGLVVLALTLALLVLVANFLFASSETQRNVTTASARWPSGTMMPSQTIYYAVEGDGPLAAALANALAQDLPEAQLAGETAVPNLVVRIERADVRWTPVLGRAEVMVTAAFSSNGDFGFREERPYFFELENGDEGAADRIVQAATEISISDESVGLLSRPGYRQKLAEAIVAELGTALQTQVFAAP